MSDLFGYSDNILPKDGEVNYQPDFITQQQADVFYHSLLETIAWQQDEALIYGKLITTRRKVAWYGDTNFSYTYSKRTRIAKPWTSELLQLKQCVEDVTQQLFNSCLLNLYHDGDDGMAWHSDDETELARHGVIASISLGAQRPFKFKHKASKEVIGLELAHGSLLQMQGTTQQYWLHQLPKSKKVTHPRVNLTFRQMNIKK